MWAIVSAERIPCRALYASHSSSVDLFDGCRLRQVFLGRHGRRSTPCTDSLRLMSAWPWSADGLIDPNRSMGALLNRRPALQPFRTSLSAALLRGARLCLLRGETATLLPIFVTVIPRAVVPSVLDPWQVLLLVRVPTRGAPADLAVVLAHWSRMRRIIGNRTTVPAREAARLVSTKGSHSLAMTGPIRKLQIPCGSRKEQAGTRTYSSEDPSRHSPSRRHRSRPMQTSQRRNG